MDRNLSTQGITYLRDDPGHQKAAALLNEANARLQQAEARYNELGNAARAQAEKNDSSAADRAQQLITASATAYAGELKDLEREIRLLREAQKAANQAAKEAQYEFARRVVVEIMPEHITRLKKVRAHYRSIVELDQEHNGAMAALYSRGAYEVGYLSALVSPDERERAEQVVRTITEDIANVERWMEVQQRVATEVAPGNKPESPSTNASET